VTVEPRPDDREEQVARRGSGQPLESESGLRRKKLKQRPAGMAPVALDTRLFPRPRIPFDRPPGRLPGDRQRLRGERRLKNLRSAGKISANCRWHSEFFRCALNDLRRFA